MSEPVPYDWCDTCDSPVEAERHLAWHAAGGVPLKVGGSSFDRSGARKVIRP